MTFYFRHQHAPPSLDYELKVNDMVSCPFVIPKAPGGSASNAPAQPAGAQAAASGADAPHQQQPEAAAHGSGTPGAAGPTGAPAAGAGALPGANAMMPSSSSGGMMSAPNPNQQPSAPGVAVVPSAGLGGRVSPRLSLRSGPSSFERSGKTMGLLAAQGAAGIANDTPDNAS